MARPRFMDCFRNRRNHAHNTQGFHGDLSRRMLGNNGNAMGYMLKTGTSTLHHGR